ncbi:hypothetical protein JCM10207_003017 [Rhodosporidiobolus poonsookiae]
MSYGGGGYGQPQTRSKVVFVGNLPFDYTEEQFIEVFNSVGPVVSFRLVFDHATGKPKGFGFCEYRDADTAASALRNLQGVEVGGRGLRLDFADTDDAPPSKRFRGGMGGPPGGGFGGGGFGAGGGGGGYGAPPPQQGGMGGAGGFGAPPPGGPGGMGMGTGGGMGMPPPGGPGGMGAPGAGAPAGAAGPPRPLPPGVPLEAGKSATDKITETIGTMAPGQLLDVMSQMKALVTASPYEARALLQSNPQLSYALFQAMLCMGIVDPAILQKAFPGHAPAVPASSAPSGPSSYPPPASYGGASASYNAPPAAYGTPPPPPGGPASYNGPSSYNRPNPPAQQQQPLSYNGPAGSQPPAGPPQGYGNYQKPAPASYNGPGAGAGGSPAPQAPPAQPAGGAATPDQAALIQQVLSMTDAQIAALDETSRNTILQIRQQAQRAMGR